MSNALSYDPTAKESDAPLDYLHKASVTTPATEEFDPSEDHAYNASLTNGKAESYRYAWALPHFDPSLKLPPLQPFDHVDPGRRALGDPNPRSFLDTATRVDDVTPYLGTTVEGIQLNKLDDKAKDQLALLVAQRKVVVSQPRVVVYTRIMSLIRGSDEGLL